MFTERLKALLKTNKLTKSKFAESVGLSRQSVVNYLNGNRHPDSITLKRISTKYNVSVDWLLGLTDMTVPNRKFQDACTVLGITEKEGQQILRYTKHNHDYINAIHLYLSIDSDQMELLLKQIEAYVLHYKASQHSSKQDTQFNTNTTAPITLGSEGLALMSLSAVCDYYRNQAAKVFESGLLSYERNDINELMASDILEPFDTTISEE